MRGSFTNLPTDAPDTYRHEIDGTTYIDQDASRHEIGDTVIVTTDDGRRVAQKMIGHIRTGSGTPAGAIWITTSVTPAPPERPGPAAAWIGPDGVEWPLTGVRPGRVIARGTMPAADAATLTGGEPDCAGAGVAREPESKPTGGLCFLCPLRPEPTPPPPAAASEPKPATAPPWAEAEISYWIASGLVLDAGNAAVTVEQLRAFADQALTEYGPNAVVYIKEFALRVTSHSGGAGPRLVEQDGSTSW